jgi:hypothetical protein
LLELLLLPPGYKTFDIQSMPIGMTGHSGLGVKKSDPFCYSTFTFAPFKSEWEIPVIGNSLFYFRHNPKRQAFRNEGHRYSKTRFN